jgi:ATP-dependent helicase HrpB
MKPLPVDAILPQLRDALRSSRNVVLSAAPGAGKTTRVPPALLEEDDLRGKKLIMLEPRRLAAQRAARYMASLRGENIGVTVGFRIRGESRVSDATRIEVVTEAVLTRMLHQHPELPGVGLLIFDEFHERGIHADTGLAFALDVQAHLREDLRILVMSATLDGLAVSRVLGNAPIVGSEGREFPVTTRYMPSASDRPVEPRVADVVRRAIREETGDVLVFLPGQREIRRVESLLTERSLPDTVSVHALYGDAGAEQQEAALAPAPNGTRKVILSTSIAETSLTIDGVRVVVDSGLARSARFDPRRGMSGLVTIPVSRAVADQRRGRAGRQGPGACYRLWTERQHGMLQPYPVPEIMTTDLAPLALDLARWGAPRGESLRFIDPPPPAHLAQARELLENLDALDEQGRLTPHGRAMADLPVHPRLAHMILRSGERGLCALACDVAALLEDRDLLRGKANTDIDLAARWHALHSGAGAERFVRERVRTEADKLRELVGCKSSNAGEESLGTVLALAYPDRIARRRGTESGRYQMVSGTGALLPEWSLLAREEFLAVADVDGIGTEVRVFLASPLQKEDLVDLSAGKMTVQDEVFWGQAEEAVVARRIRRLGALTVDEQPLIPSDEALHSAMAEGIQSMGLGSLPWRKASESLRLRSEWLRCQHLVSNEWPELSEEQLLRTLSDWLAPFLGRISRRAQLEQLDLEEVLRSRFSFSQLNELNRLAPETLTVPTGSRIRLDYSGPQPVLAVRLQEMFGQSRTPTVAGGRATVLLHLLSPAGRPLAVTQDLPSFWKNVYPDVRKEMRGRYPKHHWPEDPLEAKPTRKVKRRGGD